MAITSALCNSFKHEILTGGIHVLTTDTIKLALYSSSATLNEDTTAYTTTNEVSGSGYSAGGETLTGVSVSLSGSVAIVDFSDPSWSGASFTARGALIYNSSKSNRAIAVLDFGSDKTASGGQLRVTLPAAAADTAIIQFA
jgi:hypothetical protein